MSNNKRRKFAWEKWIDPLNNNLNEVEWPGHEPANGDVQDVEFFDFTHGRTSVDTSEQMDPEFIENAASKIHSIKPVKILNTRLGLLTVVESTTADYHFDFWVLHSNKPFTEADRLILRKCEGVEALIPLARYRIKIGFPKSGLFDLREVKQGIEEALADKVQQEEVLQLFPDDVQAEIDNKVNKLKSKGGHWLLYVLPNGKMEVFETDYINDSYKERLLLFEQSQKLVGGQVFKA